MADTVPAFNARVGETFDARVTLRGANKVPADLTLATGVTMTLWPVGSNTPVYDDVACTFTADATGKVAHQSATVITALPGDYDCEFKVTYPGAKVKKFPDDETVLLVRIHPTAP